MKVRLKPRVKVRANTKVRVRMIEKICLVAKVNSWLIKMVRTARTWQS